MKILEDEKGSLKILMEGMDIGAAQALAEQLLENKEVTFAAALDAMKEEAHAFEEALRKTD